MTIKDLEYAEFLYFEKFYSLEAIEKEFKGKYSYNEVKKDLFSFIKTKKKS